MLLILIRHGVAEDRKIFTLNERNDHLRPLTPKGEEKFKLIYKKLKKIIGPIDLIVSSPLVRAHQTAQIIRGDNPKIKLQLTETLSPGAQPKQFVLWCRQNLKKKTQCLVIVGHEPNLSLLAGWLLFGSAQCHIKIKKSGCLAIEMAKSVEPKQGMLLWLLTPKILERAANGG